MILEILKLNKLEKQLTPKMKLYQIMIPQFFENHVILVFMRALIFGVPSLWVSWDVVCHDLVAKHLNIFTRFLISNWHTCDWISVFCATIILSC